MQYKLITETAWHHEGNFKFMNELLEALVKTKVDFIKLHITLDLDEYMERSHPAYETLSKWTFNEHQWESIINKIISNKKKPILLLNDEKSVDFSKQFNPDIIEIHSVCLNDIHLINKINKTLFKETKVIIGVGGSTIDEIENAISLIQSENIILMHGFQNYPTKYEDINFGKIRKIMKMFPHLKHGYADHCSWDEPNNILVTLLGASLGMDYIEKHVTLNYGKERCDWNSAISIEMLNELIDKIGILRASEGNGKLKLNKAEMQYAKTGLMKKAAILKKDITNATDITFSDIMFKRTGKESDLSQLEVVENINKITKGKKGEIINSKMF